LPIANCQFPIADFDQSATGKSTIGNQQSAMISVARFAGWRIICCTFPGVRCAHPRLYADTRFAG
jgi:hypothetical protein